MASPLTIEVDPTTMTDIPLGRPLIVSDAAQNSCWQGRCCQKIIKGSACLALFAPPILTFLGIMGRVDCAEKSEDCNSTLANIYLISGVSLIVLVAGLITFRLARQGRCHKVASKICCCIKKKSPKIYVTSPDYSFLTHPHPQLDSPKNVTTQ